MDAEQKIEPSIELKDPKGLQDLKDPKNLQDIKESASQTNSLPLAPVNDVVAKTDTSARAVLRKKTTEFSTHDKTVFSILTISFSLFFFAMAYSTVWSYPWQSHWGRAEGKVTAITQGYKLWRHVSYEYQVKERHYERKQDFECYGYFVSPGQIVTVRYNPDQPIASVIETGANLATILYLIAGILLFITFVGLVSGSSMIKPGKSE